MIFVQVGGLKIVKKWVDVCVRGTSRNWEGFEEKRSEEADERVREGNGGDGNRTTSQRTIRSVNVEGNAKEHPPITKVQRGVGKVSQLTNCAASLTTRSTPGEPSVTVRAPGAHLLCLCLPAVR